MSSIVVGGAWLSLPIFYFTSSACAGRATALHFFRLRRPRWYLRYLTEYSSAPVRALAANRNPVEVGRRIHQRVQHGGVAPGLDRQGDEGLVEELAVGHPERDVAVPAEDVHVGILLAERAHRVQIVPAELRAGAHGKDQRIQETVLRRDAAVIHHLHAPDEVLHPLGGVLRHAGVAAGVREQDRVTLLRDPDKLLAAVLEVERVDGGPALRAVMGFEPRVDGLRIRGIDGDDRVGDRLCGLHQEPDPLVALLRIDRHLVHAEIDDVRPGPLLGLDRIGDVVEVPVAQRLRDVRNHEAVALRRVLGDDAGAVEELAGAVEIGVGDARPAVDLLHARARRPDLARGVEVLADDDDAVARQTASLLRHESLFRQSRPPRRRMVRVSVPAPGSRRRREAAALPLVDAASIRMPRRPATRRLRARQRPPPRIAFKPPAGPSRRLAIRTTPSATSSGASRRFRAR